MERKSIQISNFFLVFLRCYFFSDFGSIFAGSEPRQAVSPRARAYACAEPPPTILQKLLGLCSLENPRIVGFQVVASWAPYPIAALTTLRSVTQAVAAVTILAAMFAAFTNGGVATP